MKKTAAHTTTNINSVNKITAGAINANRELLETACRIALPVIFFALIGLACDRHFGTRPWLTLTGVGIGFIFAGILVKRQDFGTGLAQSEVKHRDLN